MRFFYKIAILLRFLKQQNNNVGEHKIVNSSFISINNENDLSNEQRLLEADNLNKAIPTITNATSIPSIFFPPITSIIDQIQVCGDTMSVQIVNCVDSALQKIQLEVSFSTTLIPAVASIITDGNAVILAGLNEILNPPSVLFSSKQQNIYSANENSKPIDIIEIKEDSSKSVKKEISGANLNLYLQLEEMFSKYEDSIFSFETLNFPDSHVLSTKIIDHLLPIESKEEKNKNDLQKFQSKILKSMVDDIFTIDDTFLLPHSLFSATAPLNDIQEKLKKIYNLIFDVNYIESQNIFFAIENGVLEIEKNILDILLQINLDISQIGSTLISQTKNNINNNIVQNNQTVISQFNRIMSTS